MNFLTLERYGAHGVTDAVERITREHGLTNVFNASAIFRGRASYVAIRAESFPGERPFRAYLVTLGPGPVASLIDLSAIAAEHGVTKTADPKLVLLRGDVYATFNTGNVHSGYNEIRLQRLTPTLGPPQRCLLTPRRMVEKNWGFYTQPDGELGILYSLAPFATLRLRSGELGTGDDLEFAFRSEAAVPSRFPRVHIGSQPLVVAPDRALVAANQTRAIRGLPRKIYFGRVAAVDLESGRLTRLSRRGLIHSWSAMLPQQRRHNPGLFSATYFAGLARVEDDLVLSYGLNDNRIGVARVAEDLVWR